eukprot:gb/GECG01008996.1/.p1 GENE.gb/GECG01008996.1/~~gb/GECG01008996.1/.p1  ORF type:complete len:180 (+),score=5.60 gb/GECG01008996.1/:1-540(+)
MTSPFRLITCFPVITLCSTSTVCLLSPATKHHCFLFVGIFQQRCNCSSQEGASAPFFQSPGYKKQPNSEGKWCKDVEPPWLPLWGNTPQQIQRLHTPKMDTCVNKTVWRYPHVHSTQSLYFLRKFEALDGRRVACELEVPGDGAFFFSLYFMQVTQVKYVLVRVTWAIMWGCTLQYLCG